MGLNKGLFTMSCKKLKEFAQFASQIMLLKKVNAEI